MNPVPLTDPSGVVRAWMCGCCGHAGEFPHRYGENADERAIARSRENAEQCCVCMWCKNPAPRAECMLECKACQAQAKAKADAERAERMRTHEECSRCDGYGWIDNIDHDCPKCDGSGWVKREAQS